MNTLPKYEKANLRVITSNLLFDKTAAERAPKMLENIKYYLPDIIGFQEANDVLHASLMKEIEKIGYKLASAWPDPEKRRESELKTLSSRYSTVNFFPIAYRADRFEEVESAFVMYTSTWTHTKGFTAAVLREKASGKLIAHINTHAALLLKIYGIEGETDATLGAKWRVDNARQMLEERQRIVEKYGDIPIFFTGDFNGGEEEQYYKKIIDGGMVNTKYCAKVSSSQGQFTFHSVVGELPDSSVRTPIDHIFVTPNVTVWVHSIETRQEVLDASDHCIVYADVSV